MSVEPHELTVPEMRDRFLAQVRQLVRYWANEPGLTPQRRCDGTAFSILALLDGGNMGLPGFLVVPAPHPEDRAYYQAQGECWWPDAPELESDIGGSLHEHFYGDGGSDA